MTTEFDAAIARLQEKLRQQEEQVSRTKELINLLCGEKGAPPMYADVGGPGGAVPAAITPDRFYGQPLATAVREILQMRKAAARGAGSTDELYEALKAGGFQFEAADEATAKRTLGISLSKNPAFHRVPSGAWGLTEWYPEAAKKRREQKKGGAQSEGAEGGAATPPDNGAK